MEMQGLIIKKATEADAKSIWQIRNNPQVRIKSNNTGKINYKNHLTWFKKKYLNVKENFCFVLKREDLLIGYCRFDREKNNYLVSIAIDPILQGQGLGNSLLKGAFKKLKTDKKILAEIKKGNTASTKLFLKNGFKILREQKDKIIFFFPKPPQLKKTEWELYNLVVDQRPQKSDCLVWLQGDRFDRGHKVVELFQKKFAPRIIISGHNRNLDKENVSTVQMHRWLIKKGIERKKIIIDDASLNTKDQAKTVIKEALKNNWKSLILVGSNYHQPRAFLTFLREADRQKWHGEIVNQAAIWEWGKIPDGGRKTTGDYLEEEFLKINKYQGDVTSKNAGIKYLLKERG